MTPASGVERAGESHQEGGRMKASISVIGVVLASLALGNVSLVAQQKKEGGKPLGEYSSILVSKFDVDKNPATEDFPKGLEVMMQSRTIQELRSKKLFADVVDGSEPAAGAEPGQAKPVANSNSASPAQNDSPRQIILSASVLTFDKGSRAARYMVGFGAGQSRVKMRFILRDALSGTEVLRFDQQGTFKGVFSVLGGSGDEAFVKAASSVVNNLIKELEKNR
jgi:uncharacterized protein DUF4410